MDPIANPYIGDADIEQPDIEDSYIVYTLEDPWIP